MLQFCVVTEGRHCSATNSVSTKVHGLIFPLSLTLDISDLNSTKTQVIFQLLSWLKMIDGFLSHTSACLFKQDLLTERNCS
jgi:hypothetical protein